MYEYQAHVTGVYDADTITVDIDLGFGIWMKKQKIRFAYIDAWEIRGEEREKGIIARDLVREWILDKDITIRTLKDVKGKYGRWLGIILFKDGKQVVNVNEKLVALGHAVLYD
jgi:micrococcal nuclease